MRTTLFLVAALAAAGCIEQEETVGSVGVALTASDGNGGTYRLTPGSRLGMAGVSYYDQHSLDGDDATIRIDVPVGDYEAELVHDAGYTTQWPLQRTDTDGTTEVVIGYLVTPMPAALTVVDGAVTTLTLAFEVPGFGVVTFDEGSVDVTLDVSETTASGVYAEMGAIMTATAVSAHPAAPPELATRLPALNDVTDMVIAATVIGPWAKTSSTAACAPADAEAIGSGHPGVLDLLIEAVGNLQLCVFASTPPVMQLLAVNGGPATTPTFSDLWTGDWLFVTYINAELPAPVFDGTNLDLDPAVGELQVPGTAALLARVRPTGQPPQSWYDGRFSANVSLQVVLTP